MQTDCLAPHMQSFYLMRCASQRKGRGLQHEEVCCLCNWSSYSCTAGFCKMKTQHNEPELELGKTISLLISLSMSLLTSDDQKDTPAPLPSPCQSRSLRLCREQLRLVGTVVRRCSHCGSRSRGWHQKNLNTPQTTTCIQPLRQKTTLNVISTKGVQCSAMPFSDCR